MIRRSLTIFCTLILSCATLSAQTTGGGGGGTTGGSGGTTGGTRSTGGGGGTTGGSGGSTGGLTMLNNSLNLAGTTSGSATRTTGSTGVNASNAFSATYGNPLFAGKPGNVPTTAPGGFGTPTFTTTTTGGANATVSSVGRTGATGTGGTTSSTSFTPTTSQNSRPISYSATLKFPTPPVNSPALQNELQGMLLRSSRLQNGRNVQVTVQDRTVILRGRATDDDERRLIEGMVRLTPGVREVKNEIEVP